MRSSDDGFTLIELLIVLIVLTILAALVMIGIGTVNHDSAKAACRTTAKTVHVAEVAYNARFKSYATVDELVSAKYLGEQPGSAQYSIAADASTGVVTGTVTDSGESCYP